MFFRLFVFCFAIFSPLSLSPAGWRQNSVSLVAKPRLDPIKKSTLALFARFASKRMSGLPPRVAGMRPNFLEARHVVLATAATRDRNRLNVNENSEYASLSQLYLRNCEFEKLKWLEFLFYNSLKLWKQKCDILLIASYITCASLIHILLSSLVTISGNKRIRTLISVLPWTRNLMFEYHMFSPSTHSKRKSEHQIGKSFRICQCNEPASILLLCLREFWTLQNELQWNFDHSLPLCHSLSLRLSIHRVLISNYSNHLSNQDK